MLQKRGIFMDEKKKSWAELLFAYADGEKKK